MAQINPIVLPTSTVHCDLMSPHLREIDKKEIWAAGGFLPKDALHYSLEQSDMSYTVLGEGLDVPIMMFGIGPGQLITGKRQIWMLSTDQINLIPMKFLRECNTYIQLMGAGSTVYNYVIEGNTKTLKWLHWLNFTILKPKPHGIRNRNFHYVERELPCVPLQQPH